MVTRNVSRWRLAAILYLTQSKYQLRDWTSAFIEFINHRFQNGPRFLSTDGAQEAASCTLVTWLPDWAWIAATHRTTHPWHWKLCQQLHRSRHVSRLWLWVQRHDADLQTCCQGHQCFIKSSPEDWMLTFWHPLLPYGYYKAAPARPD